MATNYSPKIVTDGLILCLDAANSKSYSGTGTTWTDLSGNGNHFTLSGVDYVGTSPIHFSFVNNQGDYIARSSTDVVGGLSDFSFDLIMRIDSFPDTLMSFVSYATSANNNSILIGRNGANNTALWFGSTNVGGISGPLDSDYNVGNFIHYVFTRNGSTVKVYINAVEKMSYSSYPTASVETGGTLLFGQEQDTPGGGFQSTQDFVGDLSCYRVYNKALTESEIQQNFIAHRGRYGI